MESTKKADRETPTPKLKRRPNKLLSDKGSEHKIDARTRSLEKVKAKLKLTTEDQKVKPLVILTP